ncbi:MAG: type transport system ATP-binding protein [Solirubrobacteraceae bacterium]|nr:type transport system ATP-binding protein [Solirubrobacteraceae bacterium]
MSQPPPLQIRGLTRSFAQAVVLDGLDLDVAAGERVALRGPNGSGKTTLLRCVAGTLAPTDGDVRVGGHAAGTRGARQLLGASLSQERSFYLRLTGGDNLRFFARVRGLGTAQADAAVASLEEELELATISARRVDRCSTGMVQQLAFARALIGDPSLLLLDEPTRSLDEGAVSRLWGALERRSGLAVLIATHRKEDASRCERELDLAR